MTAVPEARQDFPASKFPITVQALHHKTRAVVWELEVKAPPPGETVRIPVPALKEQLGHLVILRFLYADGTFDEAAPPGLVN